MNRCTYPARTSQSGLSLRALGTRLCVSYRRVQQLEGSDNIELATLVRVAEALNYAAQITSVPERAGQRRTFAFICLTGRAPGNSCGKGSDFDGDRAVERKSLYAERADPSGQPVRRSHSVETSAGERHVSPPDPAMPGASETFRQGNGV